MSAPIHEWVAAPLTEDVRRSLERLSRLDDAAHIAVMPDVHLAHDVCIGTVLASRRRLYPVAIGSDIGCGVSTVRVQGPRGSDLDETQRQQILAGLVHSAPIHRQPRPVPLPEHLPAEALSTPALRRAARHLGTVQLGTLGRGNHFLEIQVDDADQIWIMVHTGSRGIGRAIQEVREWEPVDAASPAGARYLADLDWAEAWAAESRRRLLAASVRVLHRTVGAQPVPESAVDCSHNHVRTIERDAQTWWVHRKGAISAADGEVGLIPGSMGTETFHVVGRGHPDSLQSSSHGAGRVLSRTEARNRIGSGDLRRQLHGVTYRDRPDLAEEAPSAYRDIGAVMRAQKPLTQVVRRVRPLIVHKR